MRPGVEVFEINIPACAKVLGVQMSMKVPPPPSVIQRAWILAIPAAFEVGVGGVRVVVDAPIARAGFWIGIRSCVEVSSSVAAEEAHIVDERVCAGHPLERDGAGLIPFV